MDTLDNGGDEGRVGAVKGRFEGIVTLDGVTTPAGMAKEIGAVVTGAVREIFAR